MSSPSRSRPLGLAPELIAHITKQIGNTRDLSNARLACKTLAEHATKELFKCLFISPTADDDSDWVQNRHPWQDQASNCASISKWDSISKHDDLRKIPRHASIHTQPDIGSYDYSADDYRERTEIGDDFKNAIANLSRFPNLDSIEITFSPQCYGSEARMFQEVAEDPVEREEMLKMTFQAIKDRSLSKENRTIRKLTIINLQNFPIATFTSSDLFRDVMADLEELHLSIVQEFNTHGPDHDYTKIELQTFPAHLCEAWLKPIAANLRALSLYYSTENWGPFPGYFDPRGIDFPKLEELALGWYTLAHDDDIDWILDIKSLRKLVLHNCRILSWIKICDSGWTYPKHGWTELGVRPGHHGFGATHRWSYGGRWAQCLDRIGEELPNLVDFRFDDGVLYPNEYGEKDQRPYGVGVRDECGVRLSPERYATFDHGTLPTHWMECDDKGENRAWYRDGGVPSNVHAESLEADQKSLDNLLAKLKSR